MTLKRNVLTSPSAGMASAGAVAAAGGWSAWAPRAPTRGPAPGPAPARGRRARGAGTAARPASDTATGVGALGGGGRAIGGARRGGVGRGRPLDRRQRHRERLGILGLRGGQRHPRGPERAAPVRRRPSTPAPSPTARRRAGRRGGIAPSSAGRSRAPRRCGTGWPRTR